MPDPLLHRLATTAAVVLAGVGQPGRPFRPRGSWERDQRARIQRMVRHARDTVPFYRDALRVLALDPEDFRDPTHLQRLPLVGRDDYMARPDAFRSRAIGPTHRVRLRTTGSTGPSAGFWHDRRSLIRNIAYGRRESAVLRGATGRDARPLTVVFRHPDSQFNRVQRFYDDALFIPARHRARSRTVPTDRPLEENVELLRRLRPAVVSAHGSYLGEVLLHQDTLEPGGWRPAAAVYTADPPTGNGLCRLRDEHGIWVQSLYRSGEALKIAFGCEVGTGLHVHPDLVHLAVVDHAGRPVPNGETGDIVLSNLLNRATVLLNYRIGDRGVLSEEGCPCGRTFPLLKRLEGRSGDVIRLASGVVLETSDLARMFQGRDDVALFQIVQTGMAFEVRVRPKPDADGGRLRRHVVAACRGLLGPDAEIRVTFSDRLGMDRRKWRPVIVRDEVEAGDGE